MTIKPVTVRAWRCSCRLCGRRWVQLKRPGARCPKCKGRHWLRADVRSYRRKK